ncbi:MAG: hypothetical protein ACKVU2_08310 [Saprospiraceae bacterium]
MGKLVEAFFHYFRENTGIRTQAQWHDTSMPGQAHEAGLLLLDIGKAMQHLGWKPALDFRETVAFTADWYTRYANSDVLRLCQEQIESYHKTWKYRMDA